MPSHSRLRPLSALAFGIIAALALAPGARAAGFQLKENSVKAMGRAFAGASSAPSDASVVANNPAAMTRFDRNTVQVDVTVVDFSASFSGGGTTAFGTALSGGDGGDAGGTTPIPALSAIFPLGDSGLTVGAMVSAPFGLKTEYEPTWVGRYHAINSELKVVDLTLSAALEISDRFSVGLGVIYERAEAELSNAIDFGSALAGGGVPGFAPQSADGLAVVKGDHTGLGWIVGLHLRPTDRFTLGFSYRSEIDHEVRGSADFSVPGNVAAVFAATGNPRFRDTGAVAPLTLPSIATLSGSYKLGDRFTLLGAASETGWSSLRAVVINYDHPAQGTTVEPFGWEDSRFYSLGAEYALNDRFTLRTGIARDHTPTNDVERSPRLPDQNRDWVSLGLTWQASEALEINAAYTHISVDNPTINNLVSSSGSRLSGEYAARVNLLGVSAQYRF
ncbi:MAG: outer membrane protein transport protein [Pseudomonadota bacterium]|nr:outer membrane protein transport protein [Pseudomonadota bacterium]